MGLMTFYYISSKVNRLDTSFLDGLKQWRMVFLKDHLYFFSNFFQIIEVEKPHRRLSDNSSSEVRPKIPGVSSRSTFDRLLQLCVG